jgi:hypothetical protein
MEEPLLLQHRDDRGVVTLTLNRPQAFNAPSDAMLAALGDASWFSLKPAWVANVTTCTPPRILRTTYGGSRPVDDPLLSAAATQRRRLIAPRRRDFGK